MSFDKMNIGKEGYCLLPGHPEKHKLELNCWVQVRRFLHDCNDYNEYVRLAKGKRDKG
jgi:hypothetical protein